MRSFLAVVIVLVACHSSPAPSMTTPGDDGGGGGSPPGDAVAPDAVLAGDGAGATDGGTTMTADAGTFGGTGTVACYSQGNPSATCTSPQHCCFTNYSSYHEGACSTSACAYGTITCDGPEDCGGQFCCAHAIRDPQDGTIGYTLACQATACGAAPFNQELCHTSSTCSHGSCVTALGNDNDLPRVLSICQ